jgi:hypothetical protein
MNDRPIIDNSANDFTVRMSVTREYLRNEIDTLRGQVALMSAQGVITPSTMELLLYQIKEIQAHTLKIENDYYDMRNQLKHYEEEQKDNK